MTHETCEQCGTSFSPAAAPGGMCPRCLLFGGAEEQPEEALSLEDLQDAIPGFRVEAHLGRGGMGTVFRARQLDLDRDVAIKFISAKDHDPSFGERFEREARTMARLNHPNIVTVHRYGHTADGDAFIVMEYVPGGDLAQLIAAGKIPEATALPLVEQVCSALAYAHDQGCVHRDIKPGNILVDAQGRVKVADFGLAKLLDENSASASTRTSSSAGVGTPLYSAPEQTKLGGVVDCRADIYALGVVLYEMLTGELPRGVFQYPSKMSGTLRRWDGLIIRAMDAKPERRFSTALDLGRELAFINRALIFRAGVRRIHWKKLGIIAACVATALFVVVPRLLPADFTITRAGSEIVFTDKSGRGGPLTLSGGEPGQLRFSAADRMFRVGSGTRTDGQSGDVSLSGVTRIVVHLNGATLTLANGIALPPDGSLEVEAGAVFIAEETKIVASGIGKITVTARRNIGIAKGASLETEDGDLTLSANATGGALGAFTGIEIAGAILTTRGTGNIALTGRGGSQDNSEDLYGVSLHQGAAVRSTQRVAGAGKITLTGLGGGTSGRRNRGIGIRGAGTEIRSVSGAITLTGDAGAGAGDNLSGIDIRDGGKVVSTGKGADAATINLQGTGGVNSSGDYNCGILVGTTDSRGVPGAGVYSVDGSIALTGIGGAGNVLCNGVFIGDGTAVVATGIGSVAITGTSLARTIGPSAGVQIFGNYSQGSGTRVSSANGDITIQGNALNPASTAISIEKPASVRASGSGRITLMGDRMGIHGPVDAGGNDVSLLPRTAGTAINLGSGLDSAKATLELSNDELSNISAGTLRIGDVHSGSMTTSGPLTPLTSVVLTSGGMAKFDTLVKMKSPNNLTVSATIVYVTLPGAGLSADGTSAISVTAKRNLLMIHGTSITTQDGNLTVSANADGSVLGNFHGVEIHGGKIQTTGIGALSLTGIGGDAAHFGVNIQEGGSISGGTGGTSVFTDSIEIGQAARISSSASPLTITPTTAGASIHLGGSDVVTGSPLTLGLTDTELSRITTGSVQWGDARSGPITITEPISPENRAKLPPAKAVDQQ